MNKESIIKELKESKINLRKVWVICGAAMVLHDIREFAGDIDLGCSSEYFNEILNNKFEVKIWPD